MSHRRSKPFPPLLLVSRHAQRIRDAEGSRNAAVVAAFEGRKDHGYTVDDIAEAAGLSRPRIYQIVNEVGGESAAEGL